VSKPNTKFKELIPRYRPFWGRLLDVSTGIRGWTDPFQTLKPSPTTLESLRFMSSDWLRTTLSFTRCTQDNINLPRLIIIFGCCNTKKKQQLQFTFIFAGGRCFLVLQPSQLSWKWPGAPLDYVASLQRGAERQLVAEWKRRRKSIAFTRTKWSNGLYGGSSTSKKGDLDILLYGGGHSS